MILGSYNGITEEVIREMSKKELEEAIIRVFSVEYIQFAETDSYLGVFLSPDDLADAFRDRT